MTVRPLAAAAGIGLVAVGVGALLAPRISSGQYGLPTADGAALGFVRATGARDAILGALVLAACGRRAALRSTLACTALIGLADAIVLASIRGPRPQHAVHLGGFAALLALALASDD